MMAERVRGSVSNGGFCSIYSSFSPHEQREPIFPTGRHPYRLGFLSVRICEARGGPALCNHCYPCESNCKWVSLLNLDIDDLSPSESGSGSVWSIEPHPRPRRLWLPPGSCYCTAFADGGERSLVFCVPSHQPAISFQYSPPLFGCALALSSCLRALHTAHGFRRAPLIYFSLSLQDKCPVRALCFPPSPSQPIYDVPAVRAIS